MDLLFCFFGNFRLLSSSWFKEPYAFRNFWYLGSSLDICLTCRADRLNGFVKVGTIMMESPSKLRRMRIWIVRSG